MNLEKFEVDVTTMSDATLKRLHEVAYGISSGADREVILTILEEEMARRREKPTSYTVVLDERDNDRKSDELTARDAVERKDGEGK